LQDYETASPFLQVGVVDNDYAAPDVTAIRVNPKTIGECVRLCDCADKKEYLYSGDIISYNNTDSNKKYIGVIKYDGELCCFAIFDKYADIWERESDWMKIKNIKKLGNVFDNPELI